MTTSEGDKLPSKRRILDQVTVLDPCPMSWDKMVGDDKVRFCGECQRKVWNFFEMTDAEVVEVMQANPERLCAQIKKTKSGQLLTKDYRPRLKNFRFSMLAMMIVATILSPLMFAAPRIYRWLLPQEIEPPMTSDVSRREALAEAIREMGGRIAIRDVSKKPFPAIADGCEVETIDYGSPHSEQ